MMEKPDPPQCRRLLSWQVPAPRGAFGGPSSAPLPAEPTGHPLPPPPQGPRPGRAAPGRAGSHFAQASGPSRCCPASFGAQPRGGGGGTLLKARRARGAPRGCCCPLLLSALFYL